jgi:hypothetical protein
MQVCPFCGLIIQGKEEPHNTMTLHILKCLANKGFAKVGGLIPREPPRKHVSELIEYIFKHTNKNLPFHEPDFYQDGNFPKFLEAAEKGLIYVCNHDNHYRAWLGFFLFAVMDVVSYDFERFNAKRYFEQNRNRFQGLSLKDPLAKPKLYISYLGTESLRFIQAPEVEP